MSPMISQYLESSGFKWITELDDVDEDEEIFHKPLLEELSVDLFSIGTKVQSVLIPMPRKGFNQRILRDSPDFWGPLVVVLIYSLLSLYGQFRVISWIITIWLAGSFMIYLLARVLGGEINWSQCAAVIGYSLLPLIVVGCILPTIKWAPLVSLLVKILGVSWCVYSAGSLLCLEELEQKRPLILYPILLLYLYFFSLYTGA